MSGEPCATRADFERLFCRLYDGVAKHFVQNYTRVELPGGVKGDDLLVASGIEGFTRILFGLMPYTLWRGANPYTEIFVKGLLTGTDSDSEFYWGKMSDLDQRVVEMVPVALMLYFCRHDTWDQFTAPEKARVLAYLKQVNHIKLPQNNWLLFRVILNIVCRKLGDATIEQSWIQCDLECINGLYLGNGWYTDGRTRLNNTSTDYYTPWGFHFYALLYSKIEPTGEYAHAMVERAVDFSRAYLYCFSPDGSAIPYGRSQLYRFAQVAFWSAAVFCGVALPYPIGVIKGIILRNIRWWFQQHPLDSTGFLNVGYAYSNPSIAEGYSSFASPYWAMKVFLILALGPEDEFWAAAELPLPVLEPRHLDCISRFCFVRDGNHAALFPAGRWVSGRDFAAKYNKFVYSNQFGFSVPQGNQSLGALAADSTLVYSECSGRYIVRNDVETFKLNPDGSQISFWTPARGVMIQSMVIPGLPWYVRIHRVRCRRNIRLYDCGFSVPCQGEHIRTETARYLQNANLCAGIRTLTQGGEIRHTENAPNTNILHERTAMLFVQTSLKPGTHLLIHAFFAAQAGGSQQDVEEPSVIRLRSDKIVLSMNSGQVSIPFRSFHIPLRYRIRRMETAVILLKHRRNAKER